MKIVRSLTEIGTESYESLGKIIASGSSEETLNEDASDRFGSILMRELFQFQIAIEFIADPFGEIFNSVRLGFFY